MWVKIMIQCIGYDYTACIDYMDPMPSVIKKATKLNHLLIRVSNTVLSYFA